MNSLTYYIPKGFKCIRFTRLHALVLSKYSYKILRKYLDTEKGYREICSVTEHGYTPLMLVLMNLPQLEPGCNKCELINLLLYNGSNIDAVDPKGNNILMLVVKYNTYPEDQLLQLISYLISEYADTTVKNFYGQTLIDYCYARGYEKIMKYILNYNRQLKLT